MDEVSEEVKLLAQDIRCGTRLAHDLLTLAGNDAQLVREASDVCHGIETLKTYIIDKRMRRIEDSNG